MPESKNTVTTLRGLIDEIINALVEAKECIELSTEYKIGSPAYERRAAQIGKLLKRII